MDSTRFAPSARLALCLVCLGASALAQPSVQSELRERQIAALNGELSAPAAAANPARLRLLLGQRAALLSDLIALNPARALALSLPQEVSERLRPNAASGTLEAQGEWQGTAEAVVADDIEFRRSQKRWYLRTAQGERLEMYFAGEAPRTPNVALRVRGVRSANRVAVSETVGVAMAQIAGAAPAGTLQCSTLGAQHIAVMMVTRPSVTAFPSAFTAPYFQQLFFGPGTGSLTTDSVNSYWKEASYGQASATGQVFGPFALAEDYDCDHLSEMETAVLSAASLTVDFTQYTRVALMFPVQECTLSGFGGLGGLGTMGCTTLTVPNQGDLQLSTAWLPVYPYQQAWDYVGVSAHELGHNLGLHHESTEDYGAVPLGALSDPGTLIEYGSPYSVMGGTWGQSNGQPILGQYSAEHKHILNWLAAGDYQEVTADGTFSLLPYEAASGLRALRVQRDPASGAWLWVEYRQPIGDIDTSLGLLGGANGEATNVFNGALVHYENSNLDARHMYLLDFNPVSTPNQFYDAALEAGQSWQDPYTPVSLTVTSATSSALSITVSYTPSCSSIQLPSSFIPATGGSGAINVTAPSGCAWTVSTPASWITLTSAASGQGNGTVTYTVPANTGSQSRTSYVWVERHSQTVTQSASAPPTLLLPSNGATGVGLTPSLTWSGPAQAASWNVYLGTTFPLPLFGNTWSPSTIVGPLTPGTVYYWRVESLGQGANVSDTWSFTAQASSLGDPVLLSPANGAPAVLGSSLALNWAAAPGATSYDVYFGTASVPPLATTTTGTSYAPASTSLGTTYYWRVVAKNASESKSSATWSFTTQIAPPLLVSPASGVLNASLTPTLTWSTAAGATSYDVYLGPANSETLATNTTARTYTPGTLTAGTRYYWHVVSRSSTKSGSSASWLFQTQVAAPVLVSPAAGATAVPLTPTLSWNAVTGATAYDVYFGSAATPPLAASGTTALTYAPATLLAGTVYYWRVMAKNSGSSAGSTTSSFTTQVAAPVLAAPANAATAVSVTPALNWSASTGATSYDVYLGTSSPPPLAGNTTAKTYAPARLLGGTQYYWQVAARNGGGAASSAVWSFTTQLTAPVLVSPASAAVGVALAPTLRWNAAAGATSYDVYFGTAAAPPLATNTTGTSFAPSGTLSSGTVYSWRVVAKNSGGSVGSETWSFTTQIAAPVLVSPAAAATGVPLTAAMSWNAAAGATSYDVYFGTVSPPPLATNTTGRSYSAGTLAGGTVYYWQVAAKNSGGSALSAIWSFTTQVAPPVMGAPANGATAVSVTPTLGWNASTGATSYDVYFGTAAAPALAANTTATSYAPSAKLSGMTKYYWQVVAKSATGSAASTVWSFTTQAVTPPAPVLTAPANGAASVSVTPTLSWGASTGATSYDVYLGTASQPPLATTVTGTSFAVPAGKLPSGTTCYWQIVAKNSAGTAGSSVWSFSTQLAPPALAAPASGATGIALTPALTWGASTGATSYDVYFGTTPSPPLATNMTATSYAPSALTAGTVYYWRVVAKNSGSTASSSTWPFTTQIAAPVLVGPASGAAGVALAAALSWNPSAGATSYDVYVGTSSPPPLKGNTTAKTYSAGTLAGGTLYYWQVVAKNSGGTASSAVWSFTTQVAAPVLTAPASAATGVSLTPALSWSASTGATSYDVYFGTATAPALATNTTSTSYTPLAKLAGTTKYYWQVVAKNAAGSAPSSVWTFTTQPVAPPAPVLTAPANGAAAVAATPALSWAASTGATSYDVYLGTTSPPPLATNTTGTAYSAAKLASGTTFYWQVVAKNSAGTGSSAIWSFTTQVGSPALTAPANAATAVPVTPTLSWTASTGATSYDVYFGSSSTTALATNTTATSYAPSAKLAGMTTYFWKVVAKNAAGSAASSTWSFTTQAVAPPAPVLTAPSNGAGAVSLTPALSWAAATGATSYEVYLGTVSPPPLVTTVTATSYTATAKLPAGTTCYWRIVAKNTAGSGASEVWSFSTQIAAPVLAAPAVSANGVSLTPALSWGAVTGAASYDVYFGTATAPPLAGNTTTPSYSPSALTAGTVYYWRVLARNAGSSAGSATWSFTTQVGAPALAAPAAGAAGVPLTSALSWSASAAATSYDVYFGTSTPPPLAGNTTAKSYNPGTLLGGTVYYWQVAAKNSGGAARSAIWSFTTQVSAPVLTAPAAGTSGVSLTPVLSWGAVTGATSYDVYFGTTSSPPLATNTTATSYAPSGALSAGTLYYWRIAAKNSGSTASSATWSFTSKVAAPALVAPAAGATGVLATTTLSWNASAGATSYDVYFGTSSPPPLKTTTTGRSYAPGTLVAGTVYYWQVAAKNSGGSTASDVRSFTTH